MNDDETRSDLEEDLVLPKRSPLIDEDIVDGDVEVESDVLDGDEEDVDVDENEEDDA